MECHCRHIPSPFDAGLRNITAGTQQLSYQLYAPALARYDRVIVFSQLQAEVLIRLGVLADRLAVIPNGVDTDRWAPTRHAGDALPFSGCVERLGSQRTFLYMGRLATEKNVEALLRAWRLVSPRLPTGDRGRRPAAQHTDEPASANAASSGGAMNPTSTPASRLMQCAEVFILPSLVEGLSLALLEAMASGTACIATDAGADGEVLEVVGIVLTRRGSPRSCAHSCQCCGTSRCSPRAGAAARHIPEGQHDQPQHRRHRSALRLSDPYRSRAA